MRIMRIIITMRLIMIYHTFRLVWEFHFEHILKALITFTSSDAGRDALVIPGSTFKNM